MKSSGRALDRPLLDSVLWIDEGGRFFSFNETACYSLGYTHDELQGLHWATVNTELREKDWPRVWDRTRRVRQWVWRTAYRRRDGSEFPVEVTANFMTAGGKASILAVNRDITGLLRAEEERLRLEAQIQHAQKLESLGVLAGGIAHDFNNLLLGILGNTGLALVKMRPDSPGRPHLEEVEKTAHRAAELVSQMLAYSGKGKFVVEVLDLNAVIVEMTRLMGVTISKKAHLELDLSTTRPVVEGDATQIRQVVINLVTNASEALDNRSGTISISTGVIEVDRAYLAETYLSAHLPAGSYAYLEVSDTGCGMGREAQEKIFDPFFTTKTVGRGLGMAAVIGIARGHGGAIRLDSAPGRGSTFRVLFPLCDQRPVRESEHGDTADLDSWRGQGKILIVDDEDVIRLVASKTVEQVGFEALLAEDGMRALEVFREHDDEIVAVLLDIAMPRLDGVETFYELRRLRPDLPILLSSGYSEQELPSFVDRQFSSYLQKPYRPERLIREFRDLLRPAPMAAVKASRALA